VQQTVIKIMALIIVVLAAVCIGLTYSVSVSADNSDAGTSKKLETWSHKDKKANLQPVETNDAN
jgi:flagellar basal body-associated protein FliL